MKASVRDDDSYDPMPNSNHVVAWNRQVRNRALRVRHLTGSDIMRAIAAVIGSTVHTTVHTLSVGEDEDCRSRVPVSNRRRKPQPYGCGGRAEQESASEQAAAHEHRMP